MSSSRRHASKKTACARLASAMAKAGAASEAHCDARWAAVPPFLPRNAASAAATRHVAASAVVAAVSIYRRLSTTSRSARSRLTP